MAAPPLLQGNRALCLALPPFATKPFPEPTRWTAGTYGVHGCWASPCNPIPPPATKPAAGTPPPIASNPPAAALGFGQVDEAVPGFPVVPGRAQVPCGGAHSRSDLRGGPVRVTRPPQRRQRRPLRGRCRGTAERSFPNQRRKGNRRCQVGLR